MIPALSLVSLASNILSEHIPSQPFSFSTLSNVSSINYNHVFKRDDGTKHDGQFIAFACLIPILVLLSGVFAGLTLGYMSLDETQLKVLSVSGSPKQREYAKKIAPIRKDGHLLLVTLLVANMIVNETLPVISSPVLGGGFQGVAVSTILIVLFSEIIPQSVCTRYGLYIGAKMAGPVRVLIWTLAIVCWPVAKLLEFVLGPHHGIIYRRAELKELIAMHASMSPHGGDLQSDTVTIIGATLDLQEKDVRQAMTPIANVFMLPIDAQLDYDTLRRICSTGHSRVPVYEEVEVDANVFNGIDFKPKKEGEGKIKVKKIVGILLVKQCVLLDPQDAIPLRKMQLNKVFFVPHNESLLGILDRFQEGRSHMAIVSRLSVERAQSVKKAVKKGLTQRLRQTVMGDSSDSSDDDDDGQKISDKEKDAASSDTATEKEKRFFRRHKRKDVERDDLETGNVKAEAERTRLGSFATFKTQALEQSMPADAVLTKQNANEYIQTQGLDPAIMPLGIITLEDVLEELIGEEIYDEFDGAATQSYIPPKTKRKRVVKKNSAPELAPEGIIPEPVSIEPIVNSTSAMAESVPTTSGLSKPASGSLQKPSSLRPINLPVSLRNPWFLRSRSAPPSPRHVEDIAQIPEPGVPSNGVEIPKEPTKDAEPQMVEKPGHLEHIKESPSPPAHDSVPQSPTSQSPNYFPAVMNEATSTPSGPGTPAGPRGPTLVAPIPINAANAPLEAIILDRRRRQALFGSSSNSLTGENVIRKPPGTPKGKAFKSSPLDKSGVDTA